MQNFDIVRYLGRWWEIGKIPFKFQIDCDLSSADYTYNRNSINISNICYKNTIPVSIATGVAVPINNNGNFKIQFNKYTYNGIDLPFDNDGEYNVLYTDYINISLVGSPGQFWILSRKPVLDRSYIPMIKSVAINNGYDINNININIRQLK